jgi:inorganic phosphate transporter, PiT family
MSAVRWGVAGNIAIAWALTLPAAGLVGAFAYWVEKALGAGVLGPLLISVAALFLLAARWSSIAAESLRPPGRKSHLTA